MGQEKEQENLAKKTGNDIFTETSEELPRSKDGRLFNNDLNEIFDKVLEAENISEEELSSYLKEKEGGGMETENPRKYCTERSDRIIRRATTQTETNKRSAYLSKIDMQRAIEALKKDLMSLIQEAKNHRKEKEKEEKILINIKKAEKILENDYIKSETVGKIKNLVKVGGELAQKKGDEELKKRIEKIEQKLT